MTDPRLRDAMRNSAEIVRLEVEVERLREIIGTLYEQRGEDVHTLRNAIRRAFRDA